MPQALSFELSSPGRRGVALPDPDVPPKPVSSLVPTSHLRPEGPDLPELSEPDAMRHFVNLSTLNHHVDKGFYPLGSCTMKYNPKVNEDVARLCGFGNAHPLQTTETAQGTLRLMHELARVLCEIGGLDEVTLQPAAGAHGEMTAVKMVRAYHAKRGNPRKKILIPDSAHGTNPASVAMTGYQAVTIRSNAQGLLDPGEVAQAMDEEVACLMVTNPNTLGLFEKEITNVAGIVHAKGGLMYMDGANLNALLGIARPGDMGFDLVHFNLHKTFSTPHGGGGPGSGPVGVKKDLIPFLPVPKVKARGQGEFYLDYAGPDSIGKVHGFYGNFAMMVRAYAYIRIMGAAGLKQVALDAILNANYILAELKDAYLLPYPGPCKHEVVLSGDRQKERQGVKTLDIAKRLLDFGFHAPTIYFPLIVHEALMIEPTETESRETLDSFIAAMKAIAQEAESDPDKVKAAPHNTPVSRLDEARAARDMNIRYRKG